MPFALIVAAVLLIGLRGRGPSRAAYLAIAVTAGLASIWQYLR